MKKIIEKIKFNSKLFDFIFNACFFLLVANIFFWPVFSYISFKPILLVSNILEYGLIVFSFLLFLLNIIRDGIGSIFKHRIFFFGLFILALIFSSVCFSILDVAFVRNVAKIVGCFFIFYLGCCYFKNAKMTKIISFSIVFSTLAMFASSLIYNIKTPSNLIEAFTGGRYRLGMLENQPNGYGLYCVFCLITLLYLYYVYRKKIILYLTFIPAFISFGTQSKKCIIISFILLLISFLIIVFSFKSKITRIIFFSFAGLAIVSVIVVLFTKTNIFQRLITSGGTNDGSTIERMNMFVFLFDDLEGNLIFGHGLNSFPNNFYRSFSTPYSSKLVFHSSIGDAFYSSGIIGLFLWILFVYRCLFEYKKGKTNTLVSIVYLIIQIIIDLTSQCWNLPLSFLILSAVSNIEINDVFKTKKVTNFKKEEFFYLEI